MLFGIFAIHSPELCPLNNEKSKKIFMNLRVNMEKEMKKQISSVSNSDGVVKFLTDLANKFYAEREKQVGDDVARQMEVFVYLNTIDTLWVEHLDTMDDLRSGIGLRGYGQRDPLVEYKREGLRLFREMQVAIDSQIISLLPHVGGVATAPEAVKLQEVHNDAQAITGSKAESKKEEVGRNDPCPCGSNKKYKKCHGR